MKIYNDEKDNNEFLSRVEDLLRQNNLPEALHLAKERLKSFPLDADARLIVCKILIDSGKLDDAREALRDVEEVISWLTAVYERVGDIYREKGFNQDAVFCYEKILSMHPGAQRAREIIEKMALLEGNENPVSEAVNVNGDNIPEPEFFTMTLAELYIKQGHLQDAQIILEEIIKKEPQNIHALSLLDKLKKTVLNPSRSNNTLSNKENLINTLNSWLKNIERLKINAAGK